MLNATEPQAAAPKAAEVPAPAAKGEPFAAESVREQARALADTDYNAPDTSLPDPIKNLSYDQYRNIRFKPDQALWRNEELPFQLQFFHRGLFFKNRVDFYEVSDGMARPIRYAPSLFSFDHGVPAPPPDFDLGFAGFRLHGPLNRPDYYDEIGVFLGASYFRAVGRGQGYGLSARGLSVNTGNAKGEEFPAFKTFWIEKPARNATALVVHALLDSPSAAAAFRFSIRPGKATVYDVEMNLYPRVDMPEPGIGTLTSMFFFGASDPPERADFRPAVHDSDALAVQNGPGEQLLRPLTNPRDLQVSTFSDTDPRGFGLLQRQRHFRVYEDLESHFEKRPSAWIAPQGQWGQGNVQLIEIPTNSEVNDNIVAFWRPKEPLRAKQAYRFAYRMTWGDDIPQPQPLAPIAQTRIGLEGDDAQRIVIDFADPLLATVPVADLASEVTTTKGKVEDVVVHPDPQIGGVRLSFRRRGTAISDLRAALKRGGVQVTEVWTYRWTP